MRILQHGYKWIIENYSEAEKCPECGRFDNHFTINNKLKFNHTNRYFLNLTCNECGCVRQFERTDIDKDKEC